MVQQRFQLVRSVRTADSEQYFVFDNEGERRESVGTINLHIKQFGHDDCLYHCTILIHTELQDDEIHLLVEEFEYRYIEDVELRRDFIVSVYCSDKEMHFSDRFDYSATPEALLNARLSQLQSDIRSATGRMHMLRGKVNEHAVCEYFQRHGYTAERAGAEMDKLGIDVIAIKVDAIVYAQVKAGQLSKNDIHKAMNSAAKLERKTSPNVFVAFVARSFPNDIELLRRDLEERYRVRLMIIPNSTISTALPEYKGILQG